MKGDKEGNDKFNDTILMICLIAITEHHAHENNFQKTYQQNRSRNISTQNVDSTVHIPHFGAIFLK